MALGFDKYAAAQAYLSCDKNEDLAANMLLNNAEEWGGRPAQTYNAPVPPVQPTQTPNPTDNNPPPVQEEPETAPVQEENQPENPENEGTMQEENPQTENQDNGDQGAMQEEAGEEKKEEEDKSVFE